LKVFFNLTSLNQKCKHEESSIPLARQILRLKQTNFGKRWPNWWKRTVLLDDKSPEKDKQSMLAISKYLTRKEAADS